MSGQERIYRSLLRLYPSDYRAAYSDQMVQLFSDQLRDEGPGRSWLKAVGDIPSSAASEHLRRNRTVAHTMAVAPSPSMRIMGMLGVIGGLVTLAAYVPIWPTNDLFNLRLVLLNVGAIAVVLAVHQRQASHGRILALSAAIPALIANLAYLILITQLVAQPGDIGRGDYGPNHFYFQGALWLTYLWFGLVTLRLGAVNRVAALALVIGSLAALLGMGIIVPMVPDTTPFKIAQGGFALIGVGWILLGLDVAIRPRRTDTSLPAD